MSLSASRSRQRLPLEAVAFGTAPGAQVHLEGFGLTGDADRLTGRNPAHGTLDEQIPALGKRERSEIYLHCGSRPATNASIVANRSTAAESCA